MSGPERPGTKFESELKACKGDDELKTHLKARLARGDFDRFPLLVHHRLQHAQQFRLLTLFSGNLQAKLRCSLAVFDLNAPPKFRALSYVWGDQSRTLPIQCNQHTAMVSVNLYSALLRLRRPDENVTIWIDALCIDQATDDPALQERAEQVRRMDQIFSKADEVMIDLGGATRIELDRFIQGYHDFQAMDWEGPSQNVQYERDNPITFYGPGHPFWSAWNRFFSRPWFSRVWIVQESVLAQKVTMLLGTAKMDPWELARMIPRVTFHKGSTKQDTTTWLLEGGSKFDRMRQDARASASCGVYANMLYYHGMYELFKQKQSLPDLLDLSRNLKATDVRDHVYALAGLVENWDDLDIEIDYTKSEEATRLSVGQALIRSGRSFYCLSRASGIAGSSLTWLPLLQNEARIDGDLDRKFMGIYYPLYRAAGETVMVASVSYVHDFLAVTGFRVDTVRTIAPVFPFYTMTPPEQLSQILEMGNKVVRWYTTLKEWASRTFANWSPADMKHNLWRTMLLDVLDDMTKYPPTPARASLPLLADYFKMFDECYEYLRDDSDSTVERNWFDYSSAQSDTTGHIYNKCHSRKFCSTDQGRMANVPLNTAHGNEIWIVLGVPLPMVLRNLGGAYAVVGPAYIHGLMDGEALKLAGRQDETIYLA